MLVETKTATRTMVQRPDTRVGMVSRPMLFDSLQKIWTRTDDPVEAL